MDTARTNSAKLTPKQASFCLEYLVDLNATQAAIRAGYSTKTARSQAQRLLTKDDIGSELAQLMENRSKRVEITADTVLSELLKIARADIGAAFNEDGSLKAIHEIPEEVRRAIAGVDVFEEFAGRGEDRAQIGLTKKLRFWEKTKALELLGRHLRLFTDKVELTGRNGGPIQTQDTRPSILEVAQFSNALYEGYRSFRDEKTGEAASLESDSIASLSEVIANFAAAGDCHGQGLDPSEVGSTLAMVSIIRKNMIPPAGYNKPTSEP